MTISGRAVLAVAVLAFVGWNAFCRVRPMNDGWDVLRAYNAQSGFIYGAVVLIAILVLRRLGR